MASPPEMHNWYYLRGREKVGPIPWLQLRDLVAEGRLHPRDMVLCSGTTVWTEAVSVAGLFPAPPAALTDPAAPVVHLAGNATLTEGPLPAVPAVAFPALSATMIGDRPAGASTMNQAPFISLVQVPGYEVLEELGRGGMGVVYRARQEKANRFVALKMLLSGVHAGKEDRARFQAEAEAVARLQHPHIVQVLEVGEHDGRPFFSLEYCGGGNLDRKLREHPLLPADAARLVEVLARAMHHAHTHHILHRDLKPANVLLTEDGTPKITDFGLAKKLDEAGHTASGAILGTPSYMSPEQAGGKAKHLTAAADIYALGALLYDCLAGRPPFRAATPLDTVLQVITDAPVPPARLNAQVPADLQTICLKCLEKNPAHRYATAEALAEDLRRFTTGETIKARPAGWAERAWKWARRRPAAAALVLVSSFALLLLLLGALFFSVWLGHERNAALAAAELAEMKEQEAERLRKEAEARELRAVEEFQRLDRTRRSLMTAQIGRAAGLWQRDPLQALQILQDREACPPELRDFAWNYYHSLCLSWKPAPLAAAQPSAINGVAVARDGKLAATGHANSTITVWDLETGKIRQTLKGHTGSVSSVAFSPDGAPVLASGSSDKTVRLWNLEDGTERAALSEHSGAVESVAFSPDGKWVVSGSGILHQNYPNSNLRHRDGEVRLWNVKEKKQERVLLPRQEMAIRCVAFSPDGKTVAAGTTHGSSVLVIGVADGHRINTIQGQAGWIYQLAFSPDGQTLAWVSASQTVSLADVKAQRPKQVLRGHQTDIFGLAWSPDGKTLASGDSQGWMKLWNPATGEERFSTRLDPSGLNAMAFTPGGTRLVTGHRSGKVVIWETVARDHWLKMNTGSVAVALTAGPNGKGPVTLAAVTNESTCLLRDLDTGKQVALELNTGQGTSAAFSGDGKLLAIGVQETLIRGGNKAGEWQLWDAGQGKRLEVLKAASGSAVTAVLFTPDSGTLIAGHLDGRVTLWDVGRRKEIALPGKAAPVVALALTPDGKTLATAGGNDITLWDLAERRERTVLKGHRSGVTAVVFMDGGKTLASSGLDRAVKLWDVTAGTPKKDLGLQAEAVLALAVSPDGQTLALGCRDRTVRLRDVFSGQQRAELTGFTREVGAVAFSPDGRFLAGGSAPYPAVSWVRGGEITVWKATPDR